MGRRPLLGLENWTLRAELRWWQGASTLPAPMVEISYPRVGALAPAGEREAVKTWVVLVSILCARLNRLCPRAWRGLAV